MLHPTRSLMIAIAACLALGPARGDEPGAPEPRQSRPPQLAQSCRTLCLMELNACERSCDSAPVRIHCLAQCQSRHSICLAQCR